MFVACGCKHINASMSLICSPFNKSAWIELQHWGLLKSLKGNLIGRVGWFLLDRVCQKNANALTAKQICSVKFLCRHFWEWRFLLKSKNRALRSLGILSHAQSCSCAGILGHAHVLVGPSMSNVTTIDYQVGLSHVVSNFWTPNVRQIFLINQNQSESISFWYFPNSKGHYLVIMVIYPQCPAHVPLSPWHLRWHTAGHRPLGRMSFLKNRRWCTCCLPESAHQILRLTKGLMISHVPNWYDDKDWSYIPRWSNVSRRYTNYYKCV